MSYLVRRLLLLIPTMVVVSIVVFGMVFLSGDPAVLMLPPEASDEQVEQFRDSHGFNDPFLVQYWRFMENAVKGDFGVSLRYNTPTMELVLQRVPATLKLSGLSMLLTVLIAVPLGTLAALKKGSAIDHVASFISVLGQAIPNYWLGFILMFIFGITLHLLPTSGGPGLKFVILPAITIAVNIMALITRMTRSSVLEALSEDYVRTARSKGVPNRIIITRHVIRNAILPIITIIALQFGYMLGGAVIIETVFSWPGLGLLTINAIYNRDYPVVQASVIFLTFAFVTINLLVDISYQFIDPRIRLMAEENK